MSRYGYYKSITKKNWAQKSITMKYNEVIDLKKFISVSNFKITCSNPLVTDFVKSVIWKKVVKKVIYYTKRCKKSQ